MARSTKKMTPDHNRGLFDDAAAFWENLMANRPAALQALYERYPLVSQEFIDYYVNSIFESIYLNPQVLTYIEHELGAPSRQLALIEDLERAGISFQGARCLDIGCSNGALLLAAKKHGATRLLGVDVSAARIESARKLCWASGIEFLVIDFAQDRVPEGTGLFDVIFCTDVLEHVPSCEAIFDGIGKCLAPDPGSTAFISLHNRLHPSSVLKEPHYGVPGMVLLRPDEARDLWYDIRDKLNSNLDYEVYEWPTQADLKRFAAATGLSLAPHLDVGWVLRTAFWTGGWDRRMVELERAVADEIARLGLPDRHAALLLARVKEYCQTSCRDHERFAGEVSHVADDVIIDFFMTYYSQTIRCFVRHVGPGRDRRQTPHQVHRELVERGDVPERTLPTVVGERGAAPNTAPAMQAPDEAVVSVRGVGKVYRLYDRPQDRLKHMLFSRMGRSYGREFWALRDVSFEVRRGEVMGIIGRNGSGKSTLLQIMAGILQPAAGEVRIRGRVAALLELGSGFNPDYTGRENVIMNGAILGVPPGEIDHRLDEIVAFADIGEFIDQPVKTYSSGMFVRLAFSVTTSLHADVLLIDEALAVGDVFFRQKCYQRLEALRERGVSIVLVSHALTEVEQFCQSALLLHGGHAVFQGSAAGAVKRYYLLEQETRLAVPGPRPPEPEIDGAAAREPGGAGSWPGPGAFLDLSRVAQVTNGGARCTGVALCDSHGRPRHVFEQGETASFFYEVELLADIEVPTGGVELVNEKGIIVHGKTTLEYGSEVARAVRRGSRLRFRQDIALEIAVGEYTFNVGVGALSSHDYDRRALCSHPELDARIIRLCLVPAAGTLAVVPRPTGTPVQLLHHGVANLPGQCQVSVVGAPACGPSSVRTTSGFRSTGDF